MTPIAQLLGAATRRLAAAGVASPRVDAEELLGHVTGLRRDRLGAAELSSQALGRYQDLLDQRAERVPLQHLTGVAGFRYLELAVGPGVFVPRPETELLAGWAIEAMGAATAPVVVDLCAGSGAIALAIANELPAARVYAVELDPHALAWAQRNLAACRGADNPPALVAGDATDPAVLAGLDGLVDAVLANPPYIPDGSTVAREVAEHDPPLALWGGPDGLAVVRRLAARAADLLRPGGILGVEHADRQGEAVPALLRAHGGYTDVVDHPDLAGRPRFTTATRR